MNEKAKADNPGPGKSSVRPGHRTISGKGEAAQIKRAPGPQWCLTGLTKTQRRHSQKLCKEEIEEEKRERDRDEWFNRVHPMMRTRQTWREKCLAREEGSGSEESGQSSVEDGVDMVVNMVFALPEEFRVPEAEVVEPMLGAKAAVFSETREDGATHETPLYQRLPPRTPWTTHNG
jgi:hypothetical protein